MNRIRSKSDVRTDWHDNGRNNECPVLNIKVHRWLSDLTDKEWQGIRADVGVTDDFNLAWIERHANPEKITWPWESACEDGWEQAGIDIQEIFGPDASVEGAGRSGGWLVAKGLPPVEEWNAIMLAKWRRFARYIDAMVEDNPYREAWLIGENIYLRQLQELEDLWQAAADVQNDAMGAYLGDRGWFSAERLGMIATELQ